MDLTRIATREGHALFFYPFAGRLAHLGLATLFSYRLSQMTPRTFSLTANDYGFGLLSSTPIGLTSVDQAGFLGPGGTLETALAAYSPAGRTDWSAGLTEAKKAGGNLVVFITDGNPNELYWRGGSGNLDNAISGVSA